MSIDTTRWPAAIADILWTFGSLVIVAGLVLTVSCATPQSKVPTANRHFPRLGDVVGPVTFDGEKGVMIESKDQDNRPFTIGCNYNNWHMEGFSDGPKIWAKYCQP
jgi:hypothetical protein